jgi:hypothetical protein
MMSGEIAKRRFVLFSESLIGAHQNEGNKTEEVIVVALTFPVRVKENSDGDIVFEDTIRGNANFKRGLALYKEGIEEYEDASIFIGFDLDETGEELSEITRAALMLEGVPSRKIYRTPLTEVGYIMIKNFADTTTLRKFIFLQQTFMSKLRSKKISKAVGLIKAFSLKYILRVKKKGIGVILVGKEAKNVINNKGTSTATVVTKCITGEE